MKQPIPAAAVHAFIELGSPTLQSPDKVKLLKTLTPYDVLNRQAWESWDAVVADLNQEEHDHLARGLVIAEKELRWCGGSVAAVIWVFRAYARRFHSVSDSLADWILAHSENPYAPFGSNRGAIRSLSEFREHQIYDRKRRANAVVETQLREDLAVARRTVTTRLHRLRQRLSKAESEARRELIVELSKLHLRDRLLHLAKDDTHPLHYYPTELAEGNKETLDPAGLWALAELKSKAKPLKKGPWRRWIRSFELT